MDTSLVIALCSLGGSGIGTLGGILINGKLMNYRIEQLEKKVDKHNNVIERVFHLEDSDRLLEEKIKVANARILDLERKGERA